MKNILNRRFPKKRLIILLVFWGGTVVNCVYSQVKLASIFTDHMVVQRDKPLNIWGRAGAGEKVTVRFNDQKSNIKADAEGRWKVTLEPMAFGGPFELRAESKSGRQIVSDILIGDVWFCSGQSNMEMPLAGWGKIKNYQEEIAQADHPGIRLFNVMKDRSFAPKQSLKGEWQVCSPQSVADFSATAYFFGRKLNQELKVPIGLINSSWGGTNIQTWISWDTIQCRPEFKGKKISDFEALIEKWSENQQKYNEALKNDPGIKEKWFLPESDTKAWKDITLPKGFEQSEIGNVDGIVWFRKKIILDEDQAKAPALLSLGVIDDEDETYVNGQLVGQVDNWYTKRSYQLPDGLLKPGENTIAVKVFDRSGGGGFAGIQEDFYLMTGSVKVGLAGSWLFRPSVTTKLFDVGQDGPNAFPSQLYNAMVAPVLNFPVKGVIWYQGEENTNYPAGYAELFQMLIKNWREKWNDPLPFIWAQLANYMAPDVVPSESFWATIRFDQHRALALPETAEAVLIDLGEEKDVHPKDKQDVGLRLALGALKVAYNRQLIYSGPVCESFEIKGNTIVISFDPKGSGLKAKGDKYGYLKGFAIAGDDHQFKWAKAYIKGNQVVIYNESVANPVAVRYAWGNNPEDANLYNEEGLPASPFQLNQ